MGISTGTGSESGTGRDLIRHGHAHIEPLRFLGGLGALAAGGALSACSRAGESAPRARSRVATTSTARPRTARPLFIGTYTSAEGGGPGIATATYDGTSGRITGTGVVEGVGDPSYLAVHPSGRTLYAVDERDAGAVTAVRLDAGGAHQVIGSRPTGGPAPCHLSVHPSGRWLLSANYGSGSVAVHPLAASGAPGERTDLVTHSEPPPGPGRSGPHAHQIVTSPDGGHVLAVDLGNDTVYTYRLDTRAGTLAEVSRTTLKPGAGPRHLTFHPSGRYAYVANELDNTVVVCAYDPRTGRLRPGAPQPTGTGSGTSYPAQLVVTGDGGYAYLANRGHNSLTRYAVEAGGSRLRLLDTVPVGGDFPRHIALSPSGGLLFAANQRSSTVTVFHVDRRTGELRSAGPAFGSPVAVCALPL
ncbi:secreted protein [Streptomyces pristinaespiralis ATCC 25486]|uniref:Secreted protein n=1 Tax=Streptomyces pristinaespiralis (strain ATCC 25486 / DSM 40338 / CBS 914.69 / JCM 4507 / KCC S-0507 / NBRC 13074 / NRRL 2958 / 5647) TaxID=457429 RepID=B5H6C3_STRE2|nr:lactonase family protein [Streptomyces pristinaespiralis]EDY62384.2 secreted protein [Streptomyces pristinaespiralis ATCC 25486]